MNSNFLDLSGRINDSIIQPFETVDHVAEAISVPFFVVGATVRDMILTYGYGIRTIRATQDIDFGVRVTDWDQYERLKQSLIATGKFTTTKDPYKLKYRGSIRIDIIPFGTVADPDSSVAWPPEGEIVLNTLAFEESHRHSLTIRLRSNPVLEIQFATLAGLAAMKIIAWSDNPSIRRRDAQDLFLLMRTYLDAGNQDRLFSEERDLVDVEDFDYVHAGARLLGRDIADMLNPDTVGTVIGILNREIGNQDRYRLIEGMRGPGIIPNDDFEEKLRLLEELKSGILDRIETSNE